MTAWMRRHLDGLDAAGVTDPPLVAAGHGLVGPTASMSPQRARTLAQDRARLHGSAELLTVERDGRLLVHGVVYPDGTIQVAMPFRYSIPSEP